MNEWLRNTFLPVINLLKLDDAAEEKEIIDGIEQSVQFRGAKLWVLVLAVFVASLGLNTNSAAVIIGAMLISPLMGPIIGMGLGIGIYDFDLLRRSGKNFLIATIFSITTATLYFLITPVAEAQSELMARTSPTIYDVLIALCGGLAGIIALCSRSQRSGNVIPGVAIATALMPPLCTVGFGIATANWSYAIGALYLFLINTIFIAFATLIGAVFIMHFHKKVFINPDREKRVKRIIYTIAFVTIIPAIALTVGMVRQNTFERRVISFIQHELDFDNTTIVSSQIDFKTRSFNIVLVGNDIDSTTIEGRRERLPYYHLDNVTMNIIQGNTSMLSKQLHHLTTTRNETSRQTESLMAQQSQKLHETELQLKSYTDVGTLAKTILPELQIIFPKVQDISMAKGMYEANDTSYFETIALIGLSEPIKDNSAEERLKEWLKQRTGIATIRIILHN